MSTLVFVRRRISVPFVALVRELTDDKLLVYSDERIVRNAKWWMDGESGHRLDLGEMLDSADQLQLDVREIKFRCRFLREISDREADGLIAVAFNRWHRIITENKVVRVISLPIDSYVTHVLSIVCDRLGIPFVSIVGTAVDGRLRFTKRGEYMGVNSQADGEDIDAFIEKCRRTVVRPDWLIGVDAKPWRVGFRRVLVDSLKPLAFLLYRIVYRDHSSFSFSPFKVQRRLMFATLARYSQSSKIESSAISDLPESFALMPLQFYPEVTSDYWIHEADMHNHHRSALAVARVVSEYMPVVVKEHPAAFARRSSTFLRELRAIPNVHFVSMGESLGRLLDKAALVVGQASTTTLQAQVIGKKVLFTGAPYFDVLASSAILSSLEPHAIREAYVRLNASDEKAAEPDVRRLVEGYFKASGKGALGGFKIFMERSKSLANKSWAGEDLRRLYSDITDAGL